LIVKGVKERVFAYSFHTACDRKGRVLCTIVTPGNVHDSRVFDELLEQVRTNFGQPSAVAMDAVYKTPYLAKLMLDHDIRPVMPYTRPYTKEGFFRKYDYVYDEYYS